MESNKNANIVCVGYGIDIKTLKVKPETLKKIQDILKKEHVEFCMLKLMTHKSDLEEE